MIDCLIFSKDRPCQLDLLLRSINQNFSEIADTTTILYKSTGDKFKRGYDIVKSRFPNFKFVEEEMFVENVREVVNGFANESCMFMVDDEVVINGFEVLPYTNILTKNPDKIHCISLRMHPKVDYTYTWKLKSWPPSSFLNLQAKQDNQLLERARAWKWRLNDVRTDWGFPSCINSHIYLTDFYRAYLNRLPFKSPNNLEIVFHFNRQNFKDIMICFDKPKTTCIANNVTQEGYSHNGNKDHFSLESINQKFLDGYIIDEKDFYGIEKNMATFDHPYRFRRA